MYGIVAAISLAVQRARRNLYSTRKMTTFCFLHLRDYVAPRPSSLSCRAGRNVQSLLHVSPPPRRQCQFVPVGAVRFSLLQYDGVFPNIPTMLCVALCNTSKSSVHLEQLTTMCAQTMTLMCARVSLQLEDARTQLISLLMCTKKET